jgi:hypothetical protein
MTYTGGRMDVVRFANEVLKSSNIGLASIMITFQGKSAAYCAVTAIDTWSEDTVREKARKHFLVLTRT